MSKADIEAATAAWHAGWNIGDKPFNAEVFRPLFAPESHHVRVFDNVMGDVIVLKSAA